MMELSSVLKKTVNLKNNLMLKEKWDSRLRERPHWHVPKICEKELKESLSSEGSRQQKKVIRCITVQELGACSSHIRQQNLLASIKLFWLESLVYKKGIIDSQSVSKERQWSQACVRGVHAWRPQRPLYEGVKKPLYKAWIVLETQRRHNCEIFSSKGRDLV